jgi:hypothetical protein
LVAITGIKAPWKIAYPNNPLTAAKRQGWRGSIRPGWTTLPGTFAGCISQLNFSEEGYLCDGSWAGFGASSGVGFSAIASTTEIVLPRHQIVTSDFHCSSGGGRGPHASPTGGHCR